MASTYQPTVIDGLTSFDTEMVYSVKQFTTKYQIVCKTYSAFTTGKIQVFVKPLGASEFVRIIKNSGAPSDIDLTNPNVILLSGILIDSIKFVPVDVEVGKTYKLAIYPIGV